MVDQKQGQYGKSSYTVVNRWDNVIGIILDEASGLCCFGLEIIKRYFLLLLICFLTVELMKYNLMNVCTIDGKDVD